MTHSKIPASLRSGVRSRSDAVAVGLVSAVGFALSGNPVAAQGSGDAPIQVPPVSVQGQQPATLSNDYKPERAQSPKYTEPLLNTPQSITVVPQALIEERAAFTLRDALRNVPGISLVAGEGGGAQGDNFRIRGFNSNTDIFVDGLRDISQYFRDPFNVEQVEVVKGPSAAYGGRGTTGGTINLVSKTPQADPFYQGNLTFGTDNTKRFTGDVNQPFDAGPLGGAAVRLNVMTHENDIAGRDFVDFQRWGIAPSVTVGLGTPTQLTLSYFHQDEDNIPEYGLPSVNGKPVPGAVRSAFYGFLGTMTEETTADVGTVELKHRFSDDLSVRSVGRYSEDTRLSIVCPPRNTPPSPLVTCGTGRDTENSFLTNQTDVTYKFGTGPLGHTLVAGFELGHETFDSQSLPFTGITPLNLFNPNPRAPFTGVRVPGASSENEADSQAVYAFDTVKLGEQWQLLGGLRWDRFDARSTGTSAAGEVTSSSRVDTFVSWRAGLLYKPAPNGSVYFSAGTSFNPSAEGGTVDVNPSPASNTELLPPEENMVYEIGAKWDLFKGGLALTAAAFHIEKTNARTRENNNVPFTVTGEQEVNGFEIGVAGNLTREWKVFGGYSFLDSETTESRNPAEVGKPIGRTPKHSFTAWTTYELPWDVQVGFGAQYMGTQTISNSNSARIPSFWVFDAMLAYRLTENVDLRLNIFNLTDEDYIQLAHGGGSHAIPGPARTALFSTAVRF